MTAISSLAESLRVTPLPTVDDMPEWLQARRRQALAHVEHHGFPTTRNEDWRYTSVAPVLEGNFTVAERPAAHGVTREALAPHLFDATWPTMVFVDGRFAPELSQLDALPAGVRAMPLAEALHADPELLERHLGRVATIDGQASSFTALNLGLATDGAVLHVQREMETDTPVHLLFVTSRAAEGRAAHPRVLVVAERHAKLAVVESWVGLDAVAYFNNPVTEVVVGDGATVQHLKVQREATTAFHIGTVEATQGRDSHFVSFSFASGAKLSRTNVYAVLGGAGCGATLNGLYMVDGEQHVDHQTRIEHAEPNCFSREVYKGILDGSSNGVFNGKVYVRPIAQQTDGKQENNNLLLSEKARVDTKPQLEIFADDVKCTHGATVGRLDETALFYMKSRGVSPELARQLLTYAFAADVLEMIELEPVKDELERVTLERFTS